MGVVARLAGMAGSAAGGPAGVGALVREATVVTAGTGVEGMHLYFTLPRKS